MCEYLLENDHLEDLEVDGGTLQWIRETGFENVEWIKLIQDHAQWWALVFEMVKLGVLLPESV